MERNRRLATWIGLILGALSALLLNSALAHASGTNKAVLMEELHRTCPLARERSNRLGTQGSFLNRDRPSLRDRFLLLYW